jgi:flavodoxin
MKTLVVFYSRSGSTKKIAQTLAKKLGADLDEIIDHTDRSGIKGWLLAGRDAMKQSLTDISVKKDPKKYDLIVVGSPVWAWTGAPAVRTYLTKYKSQIKKVAIFTTSGSDAPDKTVASLEGVLGQKSIAFTGFTGAELSQNHDSKLNDFVKKLK